MRDLLAVGSWVALAVAMWVMAYVWPPLGHVLVPIGAIVTSCTVLFLGAGIAQEVRGASRMRQYERQRAEWLARRKRGSGE